MDNLFEKSYKECEKSLYLIAFGYLHNAEDARDCVQEAAISAFRAFGKLKDKGLFKTRTTKYFKSDGTIGTKMSTVVTEKGREFLHNIISNNK